MKLGFIVLVLLLSIFANELFASTPLKEKNIKSAKINKNAQTQLTTDAQFGDHQVGGQYQVPFETVSTVENEKNIDSLIGVRKNFNDRINKSKSFRDLK